MPVVAALVVAALACSPAASQAAAKDPPKVYPLAIFPFQERGSGVEGYGAKVSDILFATLVANPELYLVDRADLDKVLEEHHLNLTGMVAPDQANQVGQLTGAKILVTGSVIEAGSSLYVVAKIIGTETTRVLGESVKGRTTDELAALAEQLAEKVAATIVKRAGELVAEEVSREERIAALNKRLGKGKRPAVLVSIAERHVGQATIDPAGETEFMMILAETGFSVIDPSQGRSSQADVLIKGEGFSEFAGRIGELTSVKARLEVKAVDRQTGKVLAADRQTTVMVDLTEQVAGKLALQEAAADIADRMLPKLVRKKK
jgi:TolB-like protein